MLPAPNANRAEGSELGATDDAAGMKGKFVLRARVVRMLLELRAREAPLGSSGYRGVLSQKAISHIADVPVREVTRAAIALDREIKA